MKKFTRFAFIIALFLIAVVFIAIPPRALAQGNEQARITQVDASNFPHVTLYVSVTGPNGEPIGVDPNRITLYENGVAIKPDQIRAVSQQAGTAEPVTTLLVMDVSGSMDQAGKLDGAKAAARAYVDQMRPGDQAGLLSFNIKTDYVQPITVDRDALKAAIGKLRAENNTAMYDALAQGVDILSKFPGRKTIIALTDGMDNASKNNADNVIQQIGPAGLTISTIGLGDPSQGKRELGGIDEAGLKSLADRAGGLYAYAKDADALTKIYQHYARVLQNEYAITFTSRTQLRDGVNRSLTVSLAAPSGAPVNAQGKYNPGGVVPEVAKIPLGVPIFPLALAALIALLLLPGIITRAGAAVNGAKRSGRVRLGKPSGATSGGPLQGARAAVGNLFSGFGKNKKASRVKLADKSPSQLRVRLR